MADVNVSPTIQATSVLRRSGISTTLPRNFAPLSLDSTEPKTPDQTFAELNLPPPPPPQPAHSSYRLRRPRYMGHNFDNRNNALPALLFASEIPALTSNSPLRLKTNFSNPSLLSTFDCPLPSIELPTTAERPYLSRGSSEPLGSTSFLKPSPERHIPHTPIAQTKCMTPDIKSGAWDMQRAASICSVRSDSSASSGESFATRPTSFDGSATSPDCDTIDPFSPRMVKIIPDTPTRRSKRLRINTSFSKDNVEWSIEMDNHLFNVYQMYLADPTVTPFKTVPGSIPPTGVCHRVARRAKETWPKASRIGVPIVKRYKIRNLLDIKRSMREKTPEPDDFLKVNAAPSLTDQSSIWPSERSTRRRLKQLCREKFTITAHYQRLRESRSPSPFSDQFTRRPTPSLRRTQSAHDEPVDQAGTYTTRELGISLVASDATAPLAQLMSASNRSTPSSVHDWFNHPIPSSNVMSSATQPTSSTHLDRLVPAAAAIPRLASPFSYSTWNGQSNRGNHRRNISHGQYDTIHATGARLLSPLQHHEHIGINANKRRAQHNLEEELSPNGSSLGIPSGAFDYSTAESTPSTQPQLVFSGNGDINQRRIRLRNRGVTLGSATNLNGQERIESLFAPLNQAPGTNQGTLPTTSVGANDNTTTRGHQPATLAVPGVDLAQRRLGSPFELDPTKRSLRNKSPRHIPSLSDPFVSTDHFGLNNPAAFSAAPPHSTSMGNIGERLAHFNTFHQHDQTPFQ